jgi:phosphatidylinositol alpha-1,6-mannosyltransferase
MRVLLITNDFPPVVGGVATYYARICATAPAQDILVLAPRFPGDRVFDEGQPFCVVRRRVPVSSHPLARLCQIVMNLVHALLIVRRQHVDAVHIGHLHLGPVGFALNRLLSVPYVIYLHGGEMAAYMRFRAVRSIVRGVVRRAQRVIVNSSFTRQHFEALGIPLPRVEVLTMSVNVDRFRRDLDTRQVRARYGLDGHRVILTVGRLVERKGHDLVIRALNRLQDAVGQIRYVIVGRGPEEARLVSLAREQGCEGQVQFLGYASDEDLPYLYAACDVFVMPSRALAQRDGIEGFGIVFGEAGACGKPVVGGNSGGIADAIDDGVTGILVDPTDADALADTLATLLLDQGEAARLGKQGRRRAEALQTAWTATVARLWDGSPEDARARYDR